MSAAAHGVLGVFAHTDSLMDALRGAREAGVPVRQVYSPVPLEEAVEYVEERRSPIRYFTLVGALAGLAGGLGLALYTSYLWDLVVAGKPVGSIVPFLVIGFEGTILIGGIGTLLGLLLFSGLPFRRFPDAGYRPEFSRDRFGVWLLPAADDSARARDLLTEAGAESVEDLGEPAEAAP